MSSNFIINPDDDTVINFGEYNGMTLRQVSQLQNPQIVKKWIRDNLSETDPVKIAVNRRKKRQALHRILRNNSNVIPSEERRPLFEIMWTGLGFVFAYVFALIFRWDKPRLADFFPPPAPQQFSVRDTIHYTPHLVEVYGYTVPKLNRPKDVDPSLYGCFVECLAKYSLGFPDWSDAEAIIAQYFKTSTADGSSFWWDDRTIGVGSARMSFIRASFNKPDSQKSMLDICNLSMASTINIPGCYFNEKNAAKLYYHVKDNIGSYQTFDQQLRAYYPELTVHRSEQRTSFVSVGAVCGQIDAICGKAIVEIKAKSSDDLSQYRRQVFGYACLHRLNYGNKIDEAYVMNFLTGKVFFMSVSELTSNIAAAHVRTLGREVCPEHELVFHSVTCAAETEIHFPHRMNLKTNPPVLIRQHHRATRSMTRSVSIVDEAAGLVGEIPPTQSVSTIKEILALALVVFFAFLILLISFILELLKEYLLKYVVGGFVIFVLMVVMMIWGKKKGRGRRN